jgi:unsaturated rhamnogalacturonyl hydrolase
VWDVLVDGHVEVRGVLETSAAAGIGAAMLRGGAVVSAGGADAAALRAAGERAVLGALAYVEDGALTRVSAGTVLQLIPFGYSVIRDDRVQPWGQGLALEAIAAWRETTPASATTSITTTDRPDAGNQEER